MQIPDIVAPVLLISVPEAITTSSSMLNSSRDNITALRDSSDYIPLVASRELEELAS